MKKCEKCGREFPDDAKFCPTCGVELTTVAEAAPAEPVTEAPVEAAAPAPETPAAPAEKPAEAAPAEKKGLSKTVKIAIGAVAAVIVLAIIGLVVKNVSSGNKAGVNRNAISFCISDDECTYVYNGKGQKTKVFDSASYHVYGYNMDRTIALVRDGDRNLWAVTIKGKTSSDKLVESPDEVYISASGNGIAVIMDEENGAGTLYLYDIKKGKAKEIASDVVASSVVLSPDGKTVAFSGDYKNSENTYRLYVSINGKEPKEIVKMGTPYAVSDKGTYTYYSKYDSDKGEYDFYVTKNAKDKNAEKLGSDLRSPNLCLNKAMNEAIFSKDGKTYVSRNGKEAESINSNYFYGVYTYSDYNIYSIESRFATVEYVPQKTLKGSLLILGGNELFYLKSLKDAVKVVGKYDQIAVSSDCKSVLYIRDSKAYKISNIAKPDNKKELGNFEDYDLENLCVMPDLSGFYFKSDNDLYYTNGKSKPKKIAEDVSGIAIDYEKKGVYYFIDYESGESNTLYFSKNGSKKKTALKDADAVTRANGGYYVAKIESKKDDDYYDFYFMKGNSAKKALTTVR